MEVTVSVVVSILGIRVLTFGQSRDLGHLSLSFVSPRTSISRYRHRNLKNCDLGAGQHMLLALVNHMAVQQVLRQRIRHDTT